MTDISGKRRTSPKVICGLHRSGTTYVGSVLAQSDEVAVIHELFNFGNGLKDVPCWYPYLPLMHDDETSVLKGTIADAIQFRGSLKRLPKKLPLIKSLVYRCFGGPLQFPWLKLRVLGACGVEPQHVVWKDPFCTFLLDYLLLGLDIKAVCILRHPCALYYSIAKQRWKFDIEHLYQQSELVSLYASDITDDDWQRARTENVYSIAILWKIMSRIVSSVSTRSENLLVIRHEDLCIDPYINFEEIYQHLGLTFDDNVKDYITQTSTASEVESIQGETLKMARNSKKVAGVWIGKVSAEDEGKLRKTIGAEWSLFYE